MCYCSRLYGNCFFFLFLGLDDWNDAQCDADVLTQVLAASQQEYLDSLKTAKESETSQSRRNSSEDLNQEVEHRAPSGGNNNGNFSFLSSPSACLRSGASRNRFCAKMVIFIT